MLGSWNLGRLVGIPVYVHWTFLLLLGWLMLISLDGGLLAALTTVGLAVAVFGCVLLHEFGHALMARYYGIRTRDITLYPIGGVARLEGMGRRPLEELAIALAGPAVNVALSLLLAGALVGLGPRHLLPGDGAAFPPAATFVAHLLAANVLLALFNLIPAFPMDGGRVLRSLLALRMGHVPATEAAARVGLVLALLIALGLPALIYLATGAVNLMPLLVGLFVLLAGQRELWAVRLSEAARHPLVLDALPADGGPVKEVVPVRVEDGPADPAGPGPAPVWVFLGEVRPARWPERPE